MSSINNINFDFKNEVALNPGGERALNCYLCGTCAAGCPISEVEADYSPRKIMRKVLLGSRDELLNSGDIWRCWQCHTCVAYCPQDVRFAGVIRALREISLKENIFDESFASKITEIDYETRVQRLERVNKLIRERNK